MFLSQALFQTASILVIILSGVVGLQMTDDKNLSTLPIAMIIVGTASMMIPASIILKKLGQRKGFMLGTVLDVLSGFILGILHRQYVKSGRKAVH